MFVVVFLLATDVVTLYISSKKFIALIYQAFCFTCSDLFKIKFNLVWRHLYQRQLFLFPVASITMQHIIDIWYNRQHIRTLVLIVLQFRLDAETNKLHIVLTVAWCNVLVSEFCWSRWRATPYCSQGEYKTSGTRRHQRKFSNHFSKVWNSRLMDELVNLLFYTIIIYLFEA